MTLPWLTDAQLAGPFGTRRILQVEDLLPALKVQYHNEPQVQLKGYPVERREDDEPMDEMEPESLSAKMDALMERIDALESRLDEYENGGNESDESDDEEEED
jgi:hypothetical protein